MTYIIFPTKQPQGNGCQPCFELGWVGHIFPGKRTGQNTPFLSTIAGSVKMSWWGLVGKHVFPGLGVSAASLLVATRGFRIARFGGFGAFCTSFPSLLLTEILSHVWSVFSKRSFFLLVALAYRQDEMLFSPDFKSCFVKFKVKVPKFPKFWCLLSNRCVQRP